MEFLTSDWMPYFYTVAPGYHGSILQPVQKRNLDRDPEESTSQHDVPQPHSTRIYLFMVHGSIERHRLINAVYMQVRFHVLFYILPWQSYHHPWILFRSGVMLFCILPTLPSSLNPPHWSLKP